MLETARLRLRERLSGDADALHVNFTDPELMRWWSAAPHTSVEQTRAMFAKERPEWRCWSITFQGDDTAIGFVAAGEKRQGNVTELGYMLARAHWGGGIAAEAVSAVIDRIFAEGQRRCSPTPIPTTRRRALCSSGWGSSWRGCCVPNGRRISACATRRSTGCCARNGAARRG
ncbi:MAG: GNAT family N-acetyltransferase [Sphingomonas sp.]